MRRPDPSVDVDEETESAPCPYCGSTDTEQEHPKGPSLCRSMHFCNACEELFESFR